MYKRERSRVGGSCDPGDFGVEAKQMHLFSESSGFVRANEVPWIECKVQPVRWVSSVGCSLQFRGLWDWEMECIGCVVCARYL